MRENLFTRPPNLKGKIIKTVWYWFRKRLVDQMSGIEGLEIDLHILVETFFFSRSTLSLICLCKTKNALRNRNCKNQSVCTDDHTSIIYNSQKWVQSKCSSTDKWLNKMWHIHKMQYYSVSKGRKFWHMLWSRWALKTLW